jgi:hypothetical protein
MIGHNKAYTAYFSDCSGINKGESGMRKIFAVAAVFALVLVGCGDGDDENGGTTSVTTLQIKNESAKEISQVIFQSVLFAKENADIIGTWTSGSFTLVIGPNTWSVTGGPFQDPTGGGTWVRNGNSLTFNSNSQLGSQGTGTISNGLLSFNYLSFMGSGLGTYTLRSEDLDSSLSSGNIVTKTVEAGSGYIFFQMNSTTYRTNDLVVVEKNNKATFTFTNNTVVVDVNSNNTGSLGSF